MACPGLLGLSLSGEALHHAKVHVAPIPHSFIQSSFRYHFIPVKFRVDPEQDLELKKEKEEESIIVTYNLQYTVT